MAVSRTPFSADGSAILTFTVAVVERCLSPPPCLGHRSTALVSHVKRRRTLVAGRCFRSLSIGLSYSKRNLFTLNWEALAGI